MPATISYPIMIMRLVFFIKKKEGRFTIVDWKGENIVVEGGKKSSKLEAGIYIETDVNDLSYGVD